AETDPRTPTRYRLVSTSRLTAQARIEQHQVLDRTRDFADGIERRSERFHAGDGYAVVCGLEGENAAVGSRADRRAAGLRAQRERHHEIGDAGDRAARRPAGGVARVVRVARIRGIKERELARLRLAR